MIRADILDAARACVTQDRASTYGKAEDSFALIARYWSAHLGHAVTATDVAAMMALLKLARIAANPSHRDSWVDLAGYAACGGEIAAQKAADHFAAEMNEVEGLLRDAPDDAVIERFSLERRQARLRAAQLRNHGGRDDAPVRTSAEALWGHLERQPGSARYQGPREGEGLSVTITESEG